MKGSLTQGRVGDSPTSSAMKRLNPIPTGAMKFPWCFSAASMNIVKTSWAVRIISIITPWALVVPPPSVVETASLPWNKACTIYAATMPATIWMTKRRTPRTIEMAPMRTMPTVTCFRISNGFRKQISTLARHAGRKVRDGLTAGLNNPPLMRKKTHAFTASENPKLKLIYSNSEGFFCAT